MEAALGHPREDLDHGVGAVLLVFVGQTQHPRPVVDKCAIEEPIDKVNVAHHVDEIQHFAESVNVDEIAVAADGFRQVAEQCGALGFAFTFGSDAVTPAAVRQIFESPAFVTLPDPVRQVEEGSLEEQHPRDPLVVTVVAHLVVGRLRPDTWMGEILSDSLLAFGSDQSEGALDPAVGGEHVRPGESGVDDAVDGFAEKGEGRRQDAKGEEEGAGQAIVKTEDGVVDDGLVGQVAHFEEGPDSGQQSDDRHDDRLTVSTTRLNSKVYSDRIFYQIISTG